MSGCHYIPLLLWSPAICFLKFLTPHPCPLKIYSRCSQLEGHGGAVVSTVASQQEGSGIEAVWDSTDYRWMDAPSSLQVKASTASHKVTDIVSVMALDGCLECQAPKNWIGKDTALESSAYCLCGASLVFYVLSLFLSGSVRIDECMHSAI